MPNETVINQNVTSHNQTGGITAHTVVVGTRKLKFEIAVANDLVAKLPSGKPIKLVSVGSQSDHAVADQYLGYLKDRGFQVPNRTMVGMMGPPPEHHIAFAESLQEVVLTIAPSAQ